MALGHFRVAVEFLLCQVNLSFVLPSAQPQLLLYYSHEDELVEKTAQADHEADPNCEVLDLRPLGDICLVAGAGQANLLVFEIKDCVELAQKNVTEDPV